MATAYDWNMRRVVNDARACLGYQQQDSPQTLAERLEEYYAANVGKVVRPSDLPPESVGLFRSHDMCQVVFWLNATLDDEALADARTLLSCDVGIRRYATYLAMDKQAQTLFRELGYLKSVWVTVLAVPRICLATVEAFRMKKRWPWAPPESFQSRPLANLRQEFGIRLV